MNEKYKGDALLQKTYTVDFLTKRKKKNEGEIPQYYVENNHEAIISEEVWELSQDLIRQRPKGRYANNYVFTEKIKCGECGGYFGAKTWHSNTKYKRKVWQCKNKYGNKSYCQIRHVSEEEVIEGFIQAVNQLLANKDHILEDLELLKETVFVTDELEEKQELHEKELIYLQKRIADLIAENAKQSQDQEAYNRQYQELVNRFHQEETALEKVSRQLEDKRARLLRLNFFIGQLGEMEETIEAFDPIFWNLHLECVEVDGEGQLNYRFKNGTIITINE